MLHLLAGLYLREIMECDPIFVLEATSSGSTKEEATSSGGTIEEVKTSNLVGGLGMDKLRSGNLFQVVTFFWARTYTYEVGV